MTIRTTHFYPRTFTFFLTSLCLLLLSIPTYAQEGLSVKVQPSIIDEQVDAGQVLEGALTVTNESGGTEEYLISVRNVSGMNDAGTPTFSEAHSNDPLEAASWVQPAVTSISVDFGESVQIPYSIVIPNNASPGSYFAAFFVTREADPSLETGAGVGFHVASLINLRVSGEVNEEMQLREFYTDGTSFFTKPEVTFKARLDNIGTIHQRPKGVITIIDMLGNEVGQLLINENSGAILPKFDRVFEATWTHEGFAFGRYTAIASVLIGETNKSTVTKEVSFWVVPLKELGIVFGSLAVLMLLFVYGVKRYVRRLLKKAGHDTLSKNETKQVSFAKRLIRTTVLLLTVLALLFIGMIVFFV